MEMSRKRGQGKAFKTFKKACMKGGLKLCNLKNYDLLSSDSWRSAA